MISPSLKKITIGYFSQDAVEMKGGTALYHVMYAASDVVKPGHAMKEMEAIMSSPMDDDARAVTLEKYGEPCEESENPGVLLLDEPTNHLDIL